MLIIFFPTISPWKRTDQFYTNFICGANMWEKKIIYTIEEGDIRTI